MGSSKQPSSSTTTVTQQERELTPEERRLLELQIQEREALQPGEIQAGLQGLGLTSALLTGGTLPGQLAGLQGGISPLAGFQTPPFVDPSQFMIGEEATQNIVQESLRDLPPALQSQGILESGTGAELATRRAADVRRQVLERNLSTGLGITEANIARGLGLEEFGLAAQREREIFNQNQLLNLLNLTIGAPAQLQQPSIQRSQVLSNVLAGARTPIGSTTTTQGYTSTPFLTGGDIMAGVGTGIGAFAAL